MKAWARTHGALVAILALALVLRLAGLAATADYVPQNDAADYQRHAVSIAAGLGYPESRLVEGGPTAARTPGYPYFLGAVYAVTGDSITAGRLANAVLGTLAVFFVYLIAARVWGERTARVAGALAAAFPPLIVLSLAVLSDSLGLVLLLGVVLALLGYRQEGGLRYALAAGLLSGLLALVRANGVLIVALVALAVLVAGPPPVRRSLAMAGTAAIAAVLVIAPWTLRNVSVFDRFVLISTHSAAIVGTYSERARTDAEYVGGYHPISFLPELDPVLSRSDIDEAQAEAELRRRGTRYALEHPGYVAEASVLNTLRLFEITPLPGRFAQGQRKERGIPDGGVIAGVMQPSALALEVLALGGIILLLARRDGRGPWFLLALPIVILVTTVPIDGRPRYRALIDPFLILAASTALVWLWSRLPGPRSR